MQIVWNPVLKDWLKLADHFVDHSRNLIDRTDSRILPIV